MKKQNRGEWAEISIKCYFVIYGGFIDGMSKKFIEFDVMWIRDSTYIPMNKGGEYGIDRIEAEKLLNMGLKRIKNGKGRTFENPCILSLSGYFGIDHIKATAREKEDIILKKEGVKSSYSIENTLSAASSFVNASKSMRITYKLVRKNGDPIDDREKSNLIVEYGKGVFNKDGKRQVKSRVQEIYKKGYMLEYSHISNKDFSNAVFDIGRSELGCLCIDYLKTKGKQKLLDVLSIHEEHTNAITFQHTRKNLQEYIRVSILETSPTGVVMPDGRGISNSGMIFLFDEQVYLFGATIGRWWEHHILKSGWFDTPASKRHDYGYVYRSDDGNLLFDYALGIRGSFKVSVMDISSGWRHSPLSNCTEKKGHDPDQPRVYRTSRKRGGLGRFI